MAVKCSICGVTIDSLEEAVMTGWIPYFTDGEREMENACPGCTEVLLQAANEEEMEVKPEFRGRIEYHGG